MSHGDCHHKTVVTSSLIQCLHSEIYLSCILVHGSTCCKEVSEDSDDDDDDDDDDIDYDDSSLVFERQKCNLMRLFC